MDEKTFEEHIAKVLKEKGWLEISNQYHELGLYKEGIQNYTQKLKEEYKNLDIPNIEELIPEKYIESLKKKDSIMILRDGCHINQEPVNFVSKNDSNNTLYFQRQYRHLGLDKKHSIDIMMWVNGFPFALMEIKNESTGQCARGAIEQILKRVDDKQALTIFENTPIKIALDTEKCYVSVEKLPKQESDFRHFDASQEFYKIPEGEFQTYSMYGDFLNPVNVMELIQEFVYKDQERKQIIFPRFHQWEAVKVVTKLVRNSFEENKSLGDQILLQHSTGSGKSKTIAWLCQFLNRLKVGEGIERDAVIQKIIVVSDRVDLDNQLQRDLRPVLGDATVRKAESKKHLKELINSVSPPIITTVIHKFMDLDLDDWDKDKRVAIIIDEAHRSQNGEMHSSMRSNLEGEVIAEDGCTYKGDEVLKKVKGNTNMVVIGLTATPGEETLHNFGKNGKEPHHVYTMEQAIKEGYILNVLENVVTYDTLYQLSKEEGKIPFLSKYPEKFLSRVCTYAAYESEDIIEEKCEVISAMIRSRTSKAIGGKGKAMVTCVSRRAASVYQKALAIKLKGYSIVPLVAYSDASDDVETDKSLNAKVGAMVSDDEGLKALFRKEDRYKVLVVASKFQTGFDEPLLHTLFIDKPLKGTNAVQTLSRLNRVTTGKTDTLVVDFTNSYEEIRKAFKRYMKDTNLTKFREFSINEIKDTFKIILAQTSTTNEDWKLSEEGHVNEGKLGIEINQKAKYIKEKIEVAGRDCIEELEKLRDGISYLNGRGIWIDDKEWISIKVIIKEIVGMFKATETIGGYSVDNLKDCLNAFGVATQLLTVREEGEVLLGEGSGHSSISKTGKTKESDLTEAIVKRNVEEKLKVEKLRAEVDKRMLEIKREASQLEFEGGTLEDIMNLAEPMLIEIWSKVSKGDNKWKLSKYIIDNTDFKVKGIAYNLYDGEFCLKGYSEIVNEYYEIIEKKVEVIRTESKLYGYMNKLNDVLEEGDLLHEELGN